MKKAGAIVKVPTRTRVESLFARVIDAVSTKKKEKKKKTLIAACFAGWKRWL